MPRHEAPPPHLVIRTIGQLARPAPHWVWLWCERPGCGHHVALPLVPLIIRWGPEADIAWLRRRFRCTRCGARETKISLPSPAGSNAPMPFPAAAAHQK